MVGSRKTVKVKNPLNPLKDVLSAVMVCYYCTFWFLCQVSQNSNLADSPGVRVGVILQHGLC